MVNMREMFIVDRKIADEGVHGLWPVAEDEDCFPIVECSWTNELFLVEGFSFDDEVKNPRKFLMMHPRQLLQFLSENEENLLDIRVTYIQTIFETFPSHITRTPMCSLVKRIYVGKYKNKYSIFFLVLKNKKRVILGDLEVKESQLKDVELAVAFDDYPLNIKSPESDGEDLITFKLSKNRLI